MTILNAGYRESERFDMRGWASMELGGNVGSDPVLREMPDGTAVCDVSLAVNASGKKDAPPTWFKAVFYGKTAEVVCSLVKKGETLRVNGRFHVEKWKAQSGDERTNYVVDVNEFSLLGNKKPDVTDPEIKVPF